MNHQLKTLSEFDIDLDASKGASFMDPALYLAPEVYDLDLTRIFPTSWIVVADITQLREPGQMVSEHIGDRHALVYRNHDGQLIAVTDGPCLQAGSPCSVCRICEHGGSIDTTAALTGLGCVPAAADVWERFVFVNPSCTAGPLLEYLAPLPELLHGHDIAQQQPIVSFTHESASNWKLLVDNGFCDYHVPFVHERLMPLIQGLDTWGQELSPNVTILTAPLTETGLEGQPLYPGVLAAGGERMANLSMAMGIYPNILLLGFRTGAVHLITWWPIAIDRTEVRVRTYDHTPPSDDDLRYGADSVELLQREDIGVCELVQKGLASSAYRPGPRHRLETRVLGFHRRYVAHLDAVVSG